jgi:DNA adenine methylase
MNPIVKWAGGKRWLIPHIFPIWENHKHRRLVEPFAGGLAVSLAFSPADCLVSDINPHLINLYRQVRSGLNPAEHCEMINDKEVYYRNRSRFNELVAKGDYKNKECASLFYYMNRTTYNGLCRFNKKGQINMPFGNYPNVNYATDFSEFAEYVKHWKFKIKSYEKLELEDDDFIYADPPYDVSFNAYYKTSFDWDEQVKLAGWLASHKGPVVASNLATDRIVDLYSRLGFKIGLVKAPRRINSNGDRTPVMEMIAIKNIDEFYWNLSS